jgi:hypothetical protein
MPGNYPKEIIQHSKHGESLKSRKPTRTLAFTFLYVHLLTIDFFLYEKQNIRRRFIDRYTLVGQTGVYTPTVRMTVGFYKKRDL